MTYLVLMPQDGCQPSAADVAAGLDAAGWSRWDGASGLPDLAVFHTKGPKGDYFEAGFWAGRMVPLVFIGGGARCHSRKQLVSRLGGWTVVGKDGRGTVEELLAALARRFDPVPTTGGDMPDVTTGYPPPPVMLGLVAIIESPDCVLVGDVFKVGDAAAGRVAAEVPVAYVEQMAAKGYVSLDRDEHVTVTPAGLEWAGRWCRARLRRELEPHPGGT